MLELTNNFALTQSQNPTKQRKAAVAQGQTAALERTPKQDSLTFGISGHQIAEEYIRRASNLNPKDSILAPILGKRFFHEIPTNLFFAMRNSQSRHIIESVPQGLQICGLSESKITTSFDKIAGLTKLNHRLNYKSFKIGNQKIIVKDKKTNGDFGVVYRLGIGNQDYAFKVYKKPKLVDSHGAFGEILLARELTRTDSNNTPPLYMACPNQHIAWTLSKYIDHKTPTPENGISYKDFLAKHELILGDNNRDNLVAGKNGVFLVDLGGVTITSTPHRDIEGNVHYHINQILNNEPSSLKLAEDEGLRISALNTFWNNYTSSADTSWAQLKRFFGFQYAKTELIETPEAKFVEKIKTKTNIPLDEKMEELQRIGAEIDVLEDFEIKKPIFDPGILKSLFPKG